MSMFNKAAIIGTGLIGGSMAIAIKKKRLAREVIGISRHKSTLLWAKKRHWIDKGSQDLSAIRGSDLVVLAAPVNTILKQADTVARFAGKECLITDVGSSKKQIVNKLSAIFPNFVGGHPLAGSEKRGIVNASEDIFKDYLCILTPGDKTRAAALNRIKRLWLGLGARVAVMDAEKHDRILSFVSHLPHAVAFSLIGIIPQEYIRFGASGLKDTTRVASSDHKLWSDIFLSNRKNMISSMAAFEKNLRRIRSAILNRDEKTLVAILKKANIKREALG
ncbi:MAG: prephenate dehydrogenase/arogenate dehydrogenase family protein [Candidatus Omnitrophota bacterium]